MEGMIWNADHVLEQALKPGIGGLPKELFRECLGVVLISIVEAGFIFSGNVGTGIVLTKQWDGSWSPPCAVGITGIGFGLLVGASVKDVVMFLMDEETLESVTSEKGLTVGSQVELTVGLGRTAKGDMDLTGRGVGMPISIAFTKGAFAGFNLEGAVLGARHKVNESFYEKSRVTPRDILVGGEVEMPEGKITLIKEVCEKLNKLSEGATEEPDAAAQEKKSIAHSQAEKASESMHGDPDVVEVDAATEAAKEASSTPS